LAASYEDKKFPFQVPGSGLRVPGSGFRVAPRFMIADRFKEPETRNPKLETLIPKPETRNPKPETLHPKPYTFLSVFSETVKTGSSSIAGKKYLQ
jgi:hypothetical protein